MRGRRIRWDVVALYGFICAWHGGLFMALCGLTAVLPTYIFLLLSAAMPALAYHALPA